jgi:hypothetical protein
MKSPSEICTNQRTELLQQRIIMWRRLIDEQGYKTEMLGISIRRYMLHCISFNAGIVNDFRKMPDAQLIEIIRNSTNEIRTQAAAYIMSDRRDQVDLHVLLDIKAATAAAIVRSQHTDGSRWNKIWATIEAGIEYRREFCPLCGQHMVLHDCIPASATEPAEYICPGDDNHSIDVRILRRDETWQEYEDNHGIDRWQRMGRYIDF